MVMAMKTCCNPIRQTKKNDLYLKHGKKHYGGKAMTRKAEYDKKPLLSPLSYTCRKLKPAVKALKSGISVNPLCFNLSSLIQESILLSSVKYFFGANSRTTSIF